MLKKRLFAVEIDKGGGAGGAPKKGPRKREASTVEYPFTSTPEFEVLLDKVCEIYGTTDRSAAVQRLHDERLNSCLLGMVGLKPGPRLIVDNTKKR